jgi:hypothetical protein
MAPKKNTKRHAKIRKLRAEYFFQAMPGKSIELPPA